MNDNNLTIENLIGNPKDSNDENDLKLSRNPSFLTLKNNNSKSELDEVEYNISFLEKEIKKHGYQLSDKLTQEQIANLMDKLNDVFLFLCRKNYSTEHY